MKISDLFEAGLLGRALWKALGGTTNTSAKINRQNIEYARKYIGNEAYKKFIEAGIMQGLLTRDGNIINPSQEQNVLNMAKEFAKQVYSGYIVTPEKLNTLNTYIQNTALTNLIQLKSWFNKINEYYVQMLSDVEQATSVAIADLTTQLIAGMRKMAPELKTEFKKFLSDLMRTSPNINIPWSNTVNLPSNIAPDDLKLYDEYLKTIITLKNEGKLNIKLVQTMHNSL